MITEKNSDAFVIYVIDRSGSMSGREEATCQGFNDFIKEQKGLPGKCVVSVILFDDKIDVLTVAQSANTLPKMNTKEGKLQYQVRGMTALRDAVGAAIKGGELWLEKHPKFNGHTVMCVVTDGMENSSTQFTQGQIKELIQGKEVEGWTISFQGGGDSWLQAKDYGIKPQAIRSFVNNSAGTYGSYTAASTATSNLRTTGSFSYDEPTVSTT